MWFGNNSDTGDKRVSVRNPPKPRNKKTEVDVKTFTKAAQRPLAQSFTVTEGIS